MNDGIAVNNDDIPDSKVHGVNMGPTWVLSAPDVGPMYLAVRGWLLLCATSVAATANRVIAEVRLVLRPCLCDALKHDYLRCHIFLRPNNQICVKKNPQIFALMRTLLSIHVQSNNVYIWNYTGMYFFIKNQIISCYSLYWLDNLMLS